MFIAGNTFNKAFKVSYSIIKKNKYPIINYIVEDTKNPLKVYKEYQYIIKYLPNPPISLALKLSSLNFKEDLINNIAQLTSKNNIKLFIDAEHQENFDRYNKISTNLLYDFNKLDYNIYKTYQLYRKNTYSDILDDIQLSNKHNLFFCAKFVRGAYWNQERNLGYLYTDKIDTDNSFNSTIINLSNPSFYFNNKPNIILATHNSHSIQLGMILNKNSKIFDFAHLLDMKDKYYSNFTKNNKIYVYVPYGPYKYMIPYLSRRLYENLDMIKNIY
tara:strand:+ start:567 stop:1385 length:819 start_codon:yes stop_codon:yes gene_type:complete